MNESLDIFYVSQLQKWTEYTYQAMLKDIIIITKLNFVVNRMDTQTEGASGSQNNKYYLFWGREEESW